MARTVKVFQMAYLPDALFNDIHAYLSSEGYEYTQYHNESVFKKGKGLATGPTFIKVSHQNNMVYLEGWMKFAVAPGLYAGEYGVHDSFGGVKASLERRFAHIETMIQMYIDNHPTDSATAQPPTEPAKRFCAYCGTPTAPGTAFCTNCGKAV